MHREVIAPPRCLREPPTMDGNSISHENTTPSGKHDTSPYTRSSNIPTARVLYCPPTHPSPEAVPTFSAGMSRCQQSRATRAAINPKTSHSGIELSRHDGWTPAMLPGCTEQTHSSLVSFLFSVSVSHCHIPCMVILSALENWQHK